MADPTEIGSPKVCWELRGSGAERTLSPPVFSEDQLTSERLCGDPEGGLQKAGRTVEAAQG